MPEVAIEKVRPHPAKSPDSLGSAVIDPTAPAYVELQVASNFSFLRGASHPDELVAQAAAMGCSGIAITDINTLAGVVRAHVAAKEVGIGFVVGSWIVLGETQRGKSDDPGLVDEEPEGVDTKAAAFATSMLLYPTDRASYGRLCRLLTRGKRRTLKGHCLLTLEDVAELQEGLLCIAAPPMVLEQGESAGAFVSHLERLRRMFNEDRLSLATSCLYGPHDHERLDLLAQIGREARVPLVATNDVHYHVPSRRALQDVLTCIRHTTTIDRASHLLFPHGERFIKGPHEMARLMTRYPHAIDRTMEIFERAKGFSLDQLRYEYPQEVCPPGKTPMAYLRDLTWKGAMERYSRPPGERGLVEPGGAWTAEPQGDVGKVRVRTRRKARASDRARTTAAVGTEPASDPTVSNDNRGQSGGGGEIVSSQNLKNEVNSGPPSGVPGRKPLSYIPNAVLLKIEHEFQLIEELGYAKYFLTVYDIVKYARSKGILCQGRGAAANSAVCFCLGVTSVDPDRIDLLFERFVSKERNEPPDIDIDFEHERREEVIQYIYEKYGRDRAALTCEVITYRGRSAVREVGKAMGLSLDCVDRMAKQIDWWQKGPPQDEQIRSQGLDPSDPTIRQVAELTNELLGFPRHISQHVGGFVITQGLLEETVPIENAAMPDRTVVEWDKDDIDAMGMLKVDCLGLGMLTVIRKALDLVQSEGGKEGGSDNGTKGQREPAASDRVSSALCPSVSLSLCPYSQRFDLTSVPQDDASVYEMMQHADTVGVFQIESRAQMSMLPRLKPACFYDLVIEVAIVRPGPIQGNMVHPYLRRRMGLEKPDYPNGDKGLEEVLGKTLGVPLFQEQAMKLAIVAAGFTPGEADQLRRAIAAWKKRPGQLESFGYRLIEGMKANGYTQQFAEQCYQQIQGFSGYGFPESHAASFALLVYVSGWLKRHHPAAFCAALINSQPMGFYAPAQLVRDAREHGVEVRPVDVNLSRWDCTLERRDKETQGDKETQEGQAQPGTGQEVAGENPPPPTWGLHGPSLRLGLRMISGFREEYALAIEQALQRHGDFKSIRALWLRTNLPVAALRRLASADAFGSMGLSRRQALWEVRNLHDEHLPLFDGNEEKGQNDKVTEGQSEREIAGEDPLSGCPCVSRSLRHSSDDPPPDQVPLPEMSPDRAVLQDYAAIGLSLKAHPISFLREALSDAKVMMNSALKDPKQTSQGKRVTVAGIVLVRQRPGTASGIIFMTIEDETGIANLIVRPHIYEKFKKAARHSVCVMATGTVERQGEVVHVQVQKILELSQALKREVELSPMSRDFH